VLFPVGAGKKEPPFPLNIGFGVAGPPKNVSIALRVVAHTTTHFYNLSMIYYKVNNVEN
jgi:hypothetical protein